jgi:hypothetical protein
VLVCDCLGNSEVRTGEIKVTRFVITDEQEKKIHEWTKGKSMFGGAIGGLLTYSFTVTSIGVVEKVIYKQGTVAEDVLDLTDYDSW